MSKSKKLIEALDGFVVEGNKFYSEDFLLQKVEREKAVIQNQLDSANMMKGHFSQKLTEVLESNAALQKENKELYSFIMDVYKTMEKRGNKGLAARALALIKKFD